MKIQHFCYTRGHNVDYGVFSASNNIDKAICIEMQSCALSLLGDGIKRDLSIPKWILIKFQNSIVFGICCANEVLSNGNKHVDDKSRPIRGIFAIILSEYNNSEIKLPFDIDYFKQLYTLEVESHWYQRKQHICNITEFIPGEFNYIKSSSTNGYAQILNTDIFKCKSLGNLNKESILSVALSLDNISLLIDNDNIEQAINKNGSFMNCLSTKVPIGEYGVKQKCPQCGKFVSAFDDGRICTECKEKETIRIINIKNEEEMDRKLKDDLDMANRKVEDLESIIESDKNSLKKKGLIIKILLGVIVVLLLALSYAYRDSFLLNILGKNKDNSLEQYQNTSANDTSHSYFRSDNPIVSVDGKGHTKYIKFYTNIHVNSLKVESNQDWITANLKSDNLIYLIIAPNDKDGARIGEIVILNGSDQCGLIEVQQSNNID